MLNEISKTIYSLTYLKLIYDHYLLTTGIHDDVVANKYGYKHLYTDQHYVYEQTLSRSRRHKG